MGASACPCFQSADTLILLVNERFFHQAAHRLFALSVHAAFCIVIMIITPSQLSKKAGTVFCEVSSHVERPPRIVNDQQSGGFRGTQEKTFSCLSRKVYSKNDLLPVKFGSEARKAVGGMAPIPCRDACWVVVRCLEE